ncbi:MAG: PAS domain S-box protein, partial [Gammaproteobacteria bacterium]|nr:PAS domain S-box protein [Gammaproteobacteria bacterium]
MNQADLQSIVDFAPDPILVADSQDRWAYVNEAGCRLLGRSRTDIVGRRVAEFLSADDHRRLPEWKTRMQRGETCIGEWSLRCREDVWLPVEVRTRMIGAGRWQAFVRDVSARKAREREQAKLLAENEAQRHRLQAALRTALRERGELLASVSQGLRSPLAELVLSADALEPLTADQEGGGAARAAAVSISESAERLARLTDDLMDVGLAVAAASSMLTLESVPASILLAKARKRFDPLTVEKGLNVTLDANIELPRVDVDQDRILRVLETLLGIAAQHTPEGGHITVSAEHGADGVL